MWSVPTKRGACAALLCWLAVFAAAYQASGRYVRPVVEAFVNVTGAGFFDLNLRHEEIRRWFAGEPVYEGASATVYPPATFALLWPFVGWLSVSAAHVLWVILSLGAAVALSVLLVRESGATTVSQKLLAFLLLPSAYATGMTVVIGQSGLLVLLAAITGTLLAIRMDRVLSDVVAAALFVFALAKPTIAVPFFWPFLLAPRRLRPALLAVLGYSVATAAAVLAQPRPVLALFDGWRARIGIHAAGARGYGSLDNLANALGQPGLYFPAALAALGALGLLVWRRRDADPWILLGLSALVARFFAYHRHYDDILGVVAAFALFRLTIGSGTSAARWLAGAGFTSLLVAQLIPTRFLGPPETYHLFNAVQTGSRVMALVILIWFALRSRPTLDRAPAEDGAAGWKATECW